MQGILLPSLQFLHFFRRGCQYPWHEFDPDLTLPVCTDLDTTLALLDPATNEYTSREDTAHGFSTLGLASETTCTLPCTSVTYEQTYQFRYTQIRPHQVKGNCRVQYLEVCYTWTKII